MVETTNKAIERKLSKKTFLVKSIKPPTRCCNNQSAFIPPQWIWRYQ